MSLRDVRVKMKRLFRWLYRRYAPRPIKNALLLTLAEVERFHWPAVSEPPTGKRILVLAPHADDESIGCGGSILRYRQDGADVQVLIMTDGALGSREIRHGSDIAQRRILQQALIQTRRQEAQNAAAILGVTQLHFLDGPDSQLRADDSALVARLGAIVQATYPDVIFLPFFTDRHADHWATNACLMALRQQPGFGWLDQSVCCGYEVWSPIYANMLVDITAQMPRKLEAIACYPSQIREVDYAKGVEGLNRYRAIAGLLAADRYAEAFYSAPFPVYQALYQQQKS